MPDDDEERERLERDLEALRRIGERNLEQSRLLVERTLERQMQDMEDNLSRETAFPASWTTETFVHRAFRGTLPSPPRPRLPSPSLRSSPPASTVTPPPPPKAKEQAAVAAKSLWEHLEDEPETPVAQAEETEQAPRASFWARLFSL